MGFTAENPLWEGSAKGRLYYRSREHQQAQFEAVAKFLPRGGRRRLLDYGCGYGDFISWLPSGYIYEGIDSDPTVIESAQRLYPGYHFRCSSKVVNANVIVCIAALQHERENPKRVVDELLDHCKLLLLTTVNDAHRPKEWLDFKIADLFPATAEMVSPEDDFVLLVTEGNL